MKRFLDLNSSDFAELHRSELLEAIRASEGRILMSEVIGAIPAMLGDISNAELAAAFGADLILLNIFDLDKPKIHGLPQVEEMESLRLLKKLCGRPVGINLEPSPLGETDEAWMFSMTAGRLANAANARKAHEMGADFLVVTGNPGAAVDNAAICSALREIRREMGEDLLLIAGKMHASGIIYEGGTRILEKVDIRDFVEAGADIILMPAPATIPGVDLPWVKERVELIHELGALALTAIGTSQEGADEESIRQIALLCKMAGADIHHLGDSGFPGICRPENLMSYGIAIRGIRHQYHRMAASIRR